MGVQYIPLQLDPALQENEYLFSPDLGPKYGHRSEPNIEFPTSFVMSVLHVQMLGNLLRLSLKVFEDTDCKVIWL